MSNEFEVSNGIIAPKAQLGNGANSIAPLNLVPGAAVSSPQNGDLWATSAGIFFHAGSITSQIGSGGGGGGVYYSPQQISNVGTVGVGSFTSTSPTVNHSQLIVAGANPYLVQINTVYNFSMPSSVTSPLAGRAVTAASVNNGFAAITPPFALSSFGAISYIETISLRRMATFTATYLGFIQLPPGESWQLSFSTAFTLHNAAGVVAYEAGTTNSALHTVFIREM